MDWTATGGPAGRAGGHGRTRTTSYGREEEEERPRRTGERGEGERGPIARTYFFRSNYNGTATDSIMSHRNVDHAWALL